jgi:putative zinc finger/helix-turn-helix YgiT family protein
MEVSTMTGCVVCGGPTKTRREKHYRYTECGLPNVIIEDAVKVTACERCAETYTSIPAIEGLHRQIAAAVIRKKGRLAPAEIRFLRKYLGWSGADFAKRTGTKPETVSRWENGRALMGPQADRLLRVLVAREAPVVEYSVDVLAQVAADDGSTTPVKVELEKGPKGWKFRGGPALVAVK